MTKWAKIALATGGVQKVIAVIDADARPDLGENEDPRYTAWVKADAGATANWLSDGARIFHARDQDLTLLRAKALKQAVALLESYIAAGEPHRGKVLQIDERSQGRIQGVALEATVADITKTKWPGVVWRMADNSGLRVDTVPEMIALARAAATRVKAIRTAYWAAVDAVAAAADADGVLALDIPGFFAALD